MNQNHYKILSILYDRKKLSAVNSMSLNEIVDSNKINLTKITIYKLLLTLTKNGYIKLGLRLGKENTYYITQLGIDAKEKLEGVA